MKKERWRSRQTHVYPALTQSQIEIIENAAEILLVHPYNLLEENPKEMTRSEKLSLKKDYEEKVENFQKSIRPEWVLSLIQTANNPDLQKSLDVDHSLT